MSSLLPDLVKIQVLSSGTGPFQLGAAATGFRGIEALVDGGGYSYSVQSGAQFELGTCVWNATSGLLIRTPLISSNGNAAVAFGANVEVKFVALGQDLTPPGALPIVQTTGIGTDVAMSQKATTDNLDALELAKAEAAAIGVSGSDTDLGTGWGDIIPENPTAVSALHALETAVEDFSDPALNKGSSLIRYLSSAAGAVARWLSDRLTDSQSVKDFGAVADYAEFTDGAITVSTNILSSATAGFSAADVGKKIVVAGAGTAGAALETTIAGFTSSTVVTLGSNASTTVSGATFGFGTDNYPAFLASLSLTEILIPRGLYFIGSTWTVPGGVSVWSRRGLFHPSSGTQLVFPPSVSTCVSLGDSGTAGNGFSLSAKGFTVTRAAGVGVTGTGINVERLYCVTLEDMKSEASSTGFRFKASDTRGLWVNAVRINTARCTDVDMEFDTWPEGRFTECRFGQNGTDEDGTAYIRVKGGSTSNPAAGPNTLVWANCQFNRGNGKHVSHFVRFENFTPGYISDVGVFKWNACHIEGFLAGIYTDSSITTLGRLNIVDCHLNSAVELFALNAGTTIYSLNLAASFFAGSITLAQTAQVSAIQITGNRISGNLSLTSGAGNNSEVITAGNSIVGNMTLAGSWTHLSVNDVVFGTLTNSATGNWSVVVPGVDQRSWTPGVSFGGGTTGITYTSQAGVVSKIGDEVFAQFQIVLSSKGSSTGNAFITGLPIAPRGGANLNSSNGGGGTVNYAVSLTGLTGGIVPRFPSGSTVDLYQWGATGMARVTDANFTNTTTIAGTIRYRGA